MSSMIENWLLSFQFLIGKLKTLRDGETVFNETMFQFLIGKLKTIYKTKIKPALEEGFNSS